MSDKKHTLFFLILILCLCFKSFGQLSKTHYIPPLTESGEGSSTPQDHYIYLSTPSNTTVNFTIKPIGLSAVNYITGTVSNSTPYEYYIGNGRNTQLFVNVNETSTIKSNKGYIIEAESPVYVSVRINAGSQAGALVSKGISGLGTIFRVGAFTNEAGRTLNNNGATSENLMSFVSVLATEDNTSVTFSDIDNNTEVENFTNAFPYTVNLNKGDSYCIAMNSYSTTFPTNNKDGLIGALVQSDKPIVVNCGSANGSFHNGNGRDYGIDQIVGLDKVGNQYIFVRGNGTDDWENILIVAHTNNTSIKINDNPITTINAGEYYVIEGSYYNANGNMYVETYEDVFAYQGVGGLDQNGNQNEANQGMFFVPPLSCETRGNVDYIANIDDIGNTNYSGGISIVTKVGATVTINNLPLSNFSTIGPSTVNGNTDYVTYKVTGLNGNVSVQGNDELYVAYFNQDRVATSGSFYSGFPSPPEINFNAQFTTLGNCIPNIALEAANAQNFDTYEWFYDDGNGSGFIPVPSSLNKPSINPTIPAKYKLIGTITCTGETLESVEVPISICPDDIDNDGIIDNIDIDNDNDGILNCTESKGDVTVNLQNYNAPQLIFQDGSVESAIISSNYSKADPANTFSGNVSGVFTSQVVFGIENKNDYSLSFTEPINIKLEEDITAVHNSVDGEYFIAKILPVNKNITLVDPDDRLLVDSNFDGNFETGVFQISGSEIHFKINPSPSGNTPYAFYANQVDGFSFIHNLSNISNSSLFTGIVSLTCFKKDNDGDGVKDELDLDSDNDGIPDFIENDGTIVTLSGVDNDNNGLDDVYDLNALPIDSDTDGVPDYLDLDSDNDGIYDLIETGQLGILSDTNLNGIEDGPAYGINGWANAAETVPDSGVLGYTLEDTDGDGIFNYISLDSDGDGCSDVIEAGFSDNNGDNLLGDSAVTIDANGLVNNANDGYTIPNIDYITIAPIIITTQPVDTVVCEMSATTVFVVSQEAEIYQWEVNTDGIIWNAIVDDANYNGSQTADLNIINVPLNFNNYLYRVKLDRSGNTCGIYSDEITFTVNLMPVANTAPTMRLCDDDNMGTMPFTLTLQNDAINTQAGMAITYHATQPDAASGDNPISSPFESGNTTIYARVENTVNPSCYDISSFDIEVYDSAFPLEPANIVPIQDCDDTTVGTDTDGFKIFDLTQREVDIFNGQSYTEFSLTYYTDSSYNNLVNNPNSFANTVAGGQTIYVRMTNNAFTDCFTDTYFEIEVFELPVVNNPSIYSQCDDISNDGQAFFNLTLDWIKEGINPNYIAEGLIFTYYEDQIEAENGNKAVAISNPSRYQDTLGFLPETVWVQAETPEGCFRVVPLTLVVNPYSGALALYNPSSIYQCDDGMDVRDGVATFDMTPIKDHISNVIFSTIDVTVHFFETQIDAEIETNEILDITIHQNTNSPNSQSIWVRIKSDLGNDCLGLEEFANLLIVEALPVANPISINRQCDDGSDGTGVNDGIHYFDTSLVESTVLGIQNPGDVSITYWDANGNPLKDANGNDVVSPIPSPLLMATQIITLRVTNNLTQDPDGPCYDETVLEFIIDEQPIINPVAPQVVCDGSSGDMDNDGFFAFDTSSFEGIIRGAQTGMDIIYDYIDENGVLVTDAITLPNPLFSETQSIMVKVVNPMNPNCFDRSTIDLVVNPLPEFSIIEEEIVCTSDPTFTVILTPIQADVTENFDYEWVFEDGTILGNTNNLEVSTPGNYVVTLTHPTTLCSRTKMVSVKASEKATITQNDLTIVDISEHNSVTINNPAGLGAGTYQFALESIDGEIYFPYQDSPIFNNVRAGIYTLYVKDEICGITELDVYVVGYRKFFTPNGDGRNDYWQIQGLSSVQSQSDILIYDRFGKLIKQLAPFSQGWDGTFNGALLPTDDYWFRVVLGDGRSFMGHFTLKR
ncbi:T9SS type B sorting domain-containing protein [Aestuariivivens sediminis]|uniref:T9SS type B sorting domain-containing protein n=1 Tax=Aestuariivivens sediminis TaxID=2913557 RepID=UPI001F579961|nr:T9SS type B sorting domain-containing protein [Aestuariivivens sediminis]